MNVTSPPPLVSPGRSLRTVVRVEKEVSGRTLIYLSLDSCMHAMRRLFKWRKDDNSCLQCRIPLQFDCKMTPEVCCLLGVEEGGGVGWFEAIFGIQEWECVGIHFVNKFAAQLPFTKCNNHF